MMKFRARVAISLILAVALFCAIGRSMQPVAAFADQLPTPEEFLGFRVGAEKKLARWDKIVEYMNVVARASDRVKLRELGKTTNGSPFIALEISSADTIKNLDHFKHLERKLYFQGGAPSEREREEIFTSGKSVVLITCNIH